MSDSAPHASHADSPAGPVMRQVGTHLRLAREERGEALHEVSAILRIRRTYLEDLEAGDLEKIPGRAYALGFLRTYADHLGFDGEAIVDEIKRTDAPLPQSPELRMREPLPESQRPPLMLVATSLVFAAMIYVGWSYWQDERTPAPTASETAAPTAREPASAGAPPPVAATEPARAEAGTADAAPPPEPTALAASAVDLPPLPPVPEPPLPDADALAADPDATEVTSAPDPAAGDAAVAAILSRDTEAPAEEAAAANDDTAAARSAADTVPSDVLAVIAAESGGGEPRALGDRDAGGRVVLFASEPSWVQIRSSDRDYVWSRTLEAGDAFFVPNREDLALWTGNAGGLRVIVDGQPLAELGARGEVRRDIPLAADRLTAQYADE